MQEGYLDDSKFSGQQGRTEMGLKREGLPRLSDRDRQGGYSSQVLPCGDLPHGSLLQQWYLVSDEA